MTGMSPEELDAVVLAVAVSGAGYVPLGEHGRCIGTTVRGTQCARYGYGGPEGGPPICGTHLSGDRLKAREEAERAARLRAFRALPADVQADRLRRTRFFVTASPACWSWPVPDLTAWEPKVPPVGAGDYAVSAETAAILRAVDSSPEGRARALLHEWQAGRCAVCETTRLELVTDHDHGTGLVRGLLCRSCNTREGVSYSPRDGRTVFTAYRERPPAAVLGISLRYWDPFTKEYARPAPPRPTGSDRWAPEHNGLAGLL